MLKHIDELRILMNNKEIHVLAINETRLDNSIPIQLITVQGYSWIYKHRNRSGGGVGFYIKDSINYRIRSDLNDPDIEILTIEIVKKNVKPFLITTWYHPPSDPIDSLYKFENCLQLIDQTDKESTILGDTNYDFLPTEISSQALELKFITRLYQYEQLIKEPTRVTENSQTLIDNFFTTNPNDITLCGVSSVCISEHCLIYGIRKSKTIKERGKIIEYRDYKKFDKQVFLSDLQSSFFNFDLNQKDVNTSWLNWKNTFFRIWDKHAPKKAESVK